MFQMFEIVQLDRGGESPGARFGRFALGGLLLAIGGAMLIIFSFALVYELMVGTFFGLCICMMIIMFGLLITRDAIAQLVSLRVRLKPTD